MSWQPPQMPLLWALRDLLGLTGTKFGCGVAACGACTVHVDGSAVRSCVTPLEAVRGKRVVTIEALGTPERPHPLQQAWVEHQVPQCGYCQSGMLMAAAALLAKQPHAERRRDRRGDHQHLPLRHLPAHPRRHPRRRAAAAAEAGSGARSQGEAPEFPAHRHWASAGVLVVGWGVLPPRPRLGGVDTLPRRRGRGRR